MKKYRFIFFVFSFYYQASFAQYSWPTDDPPEVVFGYGNLEGNTNENNQFQHHGIDIPGEDMNSGSPTKVLAIEAGEVWQIVQETNKECLAVTILTNSNEYIQYGHIDKSVLNFYSGNWPAIVPISTSLYPTVIVGDEIGVISPTNLANVSHPHVHLNYYTNFIGENYTLNPFLAHFAVNTGNKDPGTLAPDFGPLFIKNHDNNSFFSNNPVYGNIDISREITDNENGEIANPFNSLGYVQDNTAWAPLGNSHRFDGKKGSPFKVRFSILDEIGNAVYPQKEIKFDDIVNFQITQIYLLYERQKQVYYHNDGNPANYLPGANYCFKLTNIVNNHTVADQYWNSKIKASAISLSDNARCIEEAQYQDGMYNLHMEGEDAGGHITADPVDPQVRVDNFKPFVSEVTVEAVESGVPRTIYNGDWTWDATNGRLSINPLPRLIGNYIPDENGNNSLRINVTFSEPMSTSDVQLQLRSECQGLHISPVINYPITWLSDNSCTFEIPNNQIMDNAHSEMQDILVQGKDLAGNSLMGFYEAAAVNGNINANQIATRNSNGNWTNDYFSSSILGDQFHHFQIQGCFDGRRPNNIDGPMSTDCLVAEFEADNTNPSVDDVSPVYFTDLSTGATSWSWNFGDPSSPDNTSTARNPNHHYYHSGTYNVTLTVSDGSGTDVETKVSYIEVNGNNQTLLANFSPSSNSITTGQTVNFINTTTGGNGVVTYEWDFGSDASPPTSSSTNVYQVLFTSTRTVTLTATDDLGIHSIHEESITVTEVSGGGDISCSFEADLTNYTVHCWNPTATGGTGPLTFVRYEFDDGAVSNQFNATHTYQTPTQHHLYTVKAVFRDFYGEQICGTYGVPLDPPLNPSPQVHVNISMPMMVCINGAPQTNLTATAVMTPSYLDVRYQWTVHGPGNPDLYYSTYSQAGWTYNNGYLDLTAWDEGTYTFEVDAWCMTNGQHYISSNSVNIYCVPPIATVPLSITSFGTYSSCYGSGLYFSVRDGHPFSDYDIYGMNCNSLQEYFPLSADECSHSIYGSNPLQYWYDPYSGGFDGWYYTITRNSPIPSNFPATVSYTLRVYENNDANGDNKFDLAGTQTINLTYANICLDPDEVNAGGAEKFTCLGQTVILGGDEPRSGIRPLEYGWTPSNYLSDATILNPVFTPPGYGDFPYTLTVTDAIGHTATSSVMIHVRNLTANAGSDLAACIYSANHQLNGIASNGSGNYQLSWSPSLFLSCDNCATPTVSPQNTGNYTYTFTVTDVQSGCISTDQVVVSSGNTFPTVTVCPDQYTCGGEFVHLTATATCFSSCSYQWTANPGGPYDSHLNTGASPFETTVYTLTVTDNTYGCTNTAQTHVFVDPARNPVIDLYATTPNNLSPQRETAVTCPLNNVIDLYAVVSSPSNYAINWYNQPFYMPQFDNQSHVQLNPHVQTNDSWQVIVTDVATGCKSQKVIETKTDNIFYTPSAPEYEMYRGASVQINCNAHNTAGGDLHYLWDFGVDNGISQSEFPGNDQTLNPNTFTAYTSHCSRYFKCIVSDDYGCSITATPQVVYVYDRNYYYTHPAEILGITSVNNNGAICEGNPSHYSGCWFSIAHKVYDWLPSCFISNNAAYYQGWIIDQHPENQISADISHDVSPPINWDSRPYYSYYFGYLESPYYPPNGEYNMTTYSDVQFCHLHEPINATFHANQVIQVPSFSHVCGINEYFWNDQSNCNPSSVNLERMRIDAGADNNLSYYLCIPFPHFGYCNETKITASFSPSSNPRFSFMAGTEINLSNGFEVEYGAGFSADINSCFAVISGRPADSIDIEKNLAEDSVLKGNTILQSYPNPTTGHVTIQVKLDKEEQAELSLIDALGQKIIPIADGNIYQRKYDLDMVGLGLIQGVYNIRLSTKDHTYNQKLIFIQ
jgi:hypothetical protein